MSGAKIKMSEREYADFLEQEKQEKMRREGNTVEPIAEPENKPRRVGQMQAAKERKSYKEGYDAGGDTFKEKHPTLAKAVDIGKKVVGVVNKKSAGYVKDVEDVDKKLKELEKNEDSDSEDTKSMDDLKEKKPSTKKPSKKKRGDKILDGDFDFDEEDEDITTLHKTTSKQKVLLGDYKSAYGGGMGKKGYEAAYTSGIGMGSYQPAYKQKEQPRVSELSPPSKVKSAVEEMGARESTPQPQRKQPEPDRFNLQNWQSMGFPNTLPQSARGNLFRPTPQRPTPHPIVTPMVRQPYQPRTAPQPMRAPARAPLSGPLPRIGLSMNVPQLMKPRTINTPRAPSSPAHTTVPKTAQMSFMGVTFGEKKKREPNNKPITRMGEGYKNVPLVVMNGLYPKAGYNPKKDSMTKKSIIPKIRADITPNNFTMFGMRMKSKKGI